VRTTNGAVHTLRLVVIQPGSHALNDGDRIRGLGLATPEGRAVIAIQTTGALPPHDRRQCDARRSHLFKQPRYTGLDPARDISVVGRNTEGVRPIDESQPWTAGDPPANCVATKQ